MLQLVIIIIYLFIFLVLILIESEFVGVEISLETLGILTRSIQNRQERLRFVCENMKDLSILLP